MKQTKGGQMLRVERARRRLTQAQAADLAGISQRTVTALELAQTAPRLEIAFRLHETFGIPMQAWMEDAEEAA